ncbi:MAG: DNA repair protein RadC [Verrucomicrobia bacterium]|jgi:DNA repair protein RadC|nr:DNA repair protein RadC [Verrucomicrobiota bacterium]
MSTGLRIKDLPLSERPRERLVLNGADSCSNADLVAILLRTGRRGHSVVAMAEELLSRFGSLRELAAASRDELLNVKGIGRDKAVTLEAAFRLAQRMARDLAAEDPLVDTPERVASVLREELRFESVEQFYALLLNTRRRLIRRVKLAGGTLDTILVTPREVFRAAILANAAAIALAHNHPSGDPTPSEQDIRVTRDLIRAGQLLKIEVVDHVILGRANSERPKDYVSLRELGYFHS